MRTLTPTLQQIRALTPPPPPSQTGTLTPTPAGTPTPAEWRELRALRETVQRIRRRKAARPSLTPTPTLALFAMLTATLALCLGTPRTAHAGDDPGFFSSAKAAPACAITLAWDPGVWWVGSYWPAEGFACWAEAPTAVRAFAFGAPKADSAGPEVQPARVICLLEIKWASGAAAAPAASVSASKGSRTGDGTPIPARCAVEAPRAAAATVGWWSQHPGQYAFDLPPSSERLPPANLWVQ